MSVNPLNDISKVYLEQVIESAVPGKPAERLGAVTAIPKSEQDAARERLLAKSKAKREAMKTEEKDPFGRPGGKYGGVPKEGGGYDRGYKAMQKKLKELDKVKTEALDPVGQEDADIDNDGDTDKSDKYLHKRRKAIGKAISKNRGKNVKEGFSNWRQDLSEVMDDDVDNKPIKEKKVNNKVKTSAMGGGLKLGEAVEEIGGTLLEMVEIDEVDYIVESVYDELLDEGYEEDDIEEALEYALIEAKVTYGHDTDKPYQKKTGAGQLVRAVGRLARQKLSSKVAGAKKSASAAVARGARKVAKGALGVARKMEGGDRKPSTAHTKTRSASTYRAAGSGQKEKVSSGSYTPPSKKKAEKPSDPWEGSYKKSSEVESKKPVTKTKKAPAPKAKAPAAKPAPKRKRKSKLDNLLADIRSENFNIDEKMNLATADMGDVIKDFQQSDAPQFKGKTKEERRKMALAAKLTAERGGRKLGEQMDDSTEMSANQTDDKGMVQQKRKIQTQKIRDLTVRLSAARKGVY